jgi:ATP-dependent Clp protease protease subunit
MAMVNKAPVATPPGPRTIELKEEVTQEAADRIVTDLALPGPVTLVIDSPGGSVEAGWVIINALKDHNGTVECRVDGLAASMAFIISESEGCVYRTATTRSVFMGHAAAVATIVRGQGPDFEKAGQNIAAVLRAYSRAMAYYVCKRIPGLETEQCVNGMSEGREFWICANDLLKLGGLDKVL